MKIVGRSKAIAASRTVIRPVLTILLGTTAGAAIAASPPPRAFSPGEGLPRFPDGKFAMPVGDGASTFDVSRRIQIAYRETADPLRTRDLSHYASILLAPATSGPPADQTASRSGVIGTGASALFDTSLPDPRIAATQVASQLVPRLSRSKLANGKVNAAGLASSRSQFRPTAAFWAPKPVQAAARLHKPPRPAAISAPAIASRASNLIVTGRGIEFDTPAFVNGALAGSVPMLIADGRNISVRLADVLALVQPLMERRAYEALRKSKAATDYVTLDMLRAAGIVARMDSQDQLLLGATPKAKGEEAERDGSAFTGPVDLGYYSDNLTDSPDGGTLVNTTSLTMRADLAVLRWNLSVDAAFKVARGMTPSAAEQQRSGLAGSTRRQPFYKTAGMTDLRISAERSVRLAGGLKLDLLARATLPTGKRGIARARGRYEMLVDAGVSTRIAKTDVWAGTARRFRTTGFYTSGRDIDEVYAGAERSVGKSTTVRADLLYAQSPWRGEPREYSISGSVSRALRSGLILDLSVLAYRDAYGKGFQGGLTLRMPMRAL